MPCSTVLKSGTWKPIVMNLDHVIVRETWWNKSSSRLRKLSAQMCLRIMVLLHHEPKLVRWRCEKGRKAALIRRPRRQTSSSFAHATRQMIPNLRLSETIHTRRTISQGSKLPSIRSRQTSSPSTQKRSWTTPSAIRKRKNGETAISLSRWRPQIWKRIRSWCIRFRHLTLMRTA